MAQAFNPSIGETEARESLLLSSRIAWSPHFQPRIHGKAFAINRTAQNQARKNYCSQSINSCKMTGEENAVICGTQ